VGMMVLDGPRRTVKRSWFSSNARLASLINASALWNHHNVSTGKQRDESDEETKETDAVMT
jgi:hypothetical protein